MKKFCKILILLVILILSNILAIKMACNIETNTTLRIEVAHSHQESFQLFYSKDNTFTEENSCSFSYDPAVNNTLLIEVPVEPNHQYFRLDIGNTPGDAIIKSVTLASGRTCIPIELSRLFEGRNFEPTQYVLSDEELSLTFDYSDPFFLFQITQQDRSVLNHDSWRMALPVIFLACGIVNFAIFVIVKKRASVYTLVSTLLDNRKLIWNLSKNDFKTKYAGSALGIVWAFIQPLVTIMVYWMVFQFGLRSSSPVADTPFIVWLTAGMIPWMFFNEALMNATVCFIEYSYLVKKVVFKISILPLVKIISSFFVHVVFLSFVTILCVVYGTIDGMEVLQILYYMICLVTLIVGLSFITSAFNVFLKDFGQVISIILQIGMWATPILWPSSIVPHRFQFVLKINPMYYIVEGYRDAFTCNGIWFWDKGFQTFFFWIVSVVFFVIGASVFKRMKNHFADVL